MSDHVYKALTAYREGKTYTMNNSPKAKGSLFDTELQLKISSQVPLPDRLLMRRCFTAQNRSLIFARKGRMSVARQAIFESSSIILASGLTTDAKLICEIFYESAAAYLDYLKGEFESAKARISRAMSLDVRMEKESGYDILALHRVQLAHNLMRLEKRCGNYAVVFQYGSKLLNYLEGESSDWPIPEFGGCGDVHIVPELLTTMFIQIVSELSLTLMNAHSVEDQLFSSIAKHANYNPNSQCIIFPIPHEWIRVKQAYIDNDILLFLNLVSRFLIQRPRELPLLWYAAVLDLYEICKQIDCSDALKLRNEIASDTEGNASLPYDIRTRFQKGKFHNLS